MLLKYFNILLLPKLCQVLLIGKHCNKDMLILMHVYLYFASVRICENSICGEVINLSPQSDFTTYFSSKYLKIWRTEICF